MHDHVQERLVESEFQVTADDAVRLVCESQRIAGVDVFTDGEQRRDSYASFVAGLLDNCQPVQLVDLLPYVDDPNEFEKERRALDVPARDVRHPAVFGPLGRSRSLAVHEFAFLSRLTNNPIKVALPGLYLLTRTMWMECIADRAYASRDELARDVVRVLREELQALLHAGVSLVQFDEPVCLRSLFQAVVADARLCAVFLENDCRWLLNWLLPKNCFGVRRSTFRSPASRLIYAGVIGPATSRLR